MGRQVSPYHRLCISFAAADFWAASLLITGRFLVWRKFKTRYFRSYNEQLYAGCAEDSEGERLCVGLLGNFSNQRYAYVKFAHFGVSAQSVYWNRASD
jgi:predicted small integral membrane protein